ncbi:MAG TPA: sulfatase/phosphatase domain-containing protein, partial [Chloroflexota bacterium]
FRGRKRSLYEGGVRMPLIVRWPGHVPAGAVDNDSVFSSVDFLPTLCTLASARLPEGWQGSGEDRSAALQGDSLARRTPLYWEWRFAIIGHVLHRSPMLAIRDGSWKLLLNPDRSRIELYDIPRDPMELNNLAAAEPAVVARLAEQALVWHASLPAGPSVPTAGSNAYPWPT